MKVGIFVDAYYPQVNGVITSVMHLKKGLEAAGHEVYIITVKVPPYEEYDTHIIRIKSITWLPAPEFRLALVTKRNSIYKKLQQLQFDIIHTNSEFTVGLLGKHLAHEFNIPLVHTYHTMYEEYTHHVLPFAHKQLKKIIRFLSKKFLDTYDTVIVPSRKVELLLKQYKVTVPMHIIPTGIDFDNFSTLGCNEKHIQHIKKKLLLTDDMFVIVIVGRIAVEKNIETLINVLPRLVKSQQNIRVVIVGDGTQKKVLENQVNNLHLQSFVFFTGRVPTKEIGAYYKLGQLCINTSQTETQGLTIFEAVAAKTPVLVYDDINIEGFILNQETGLLFKNADQLLSQIQYAMMHKEQLKQYADAAYQKGLMFSHTQFGKNVAALYENITMTKQDTNEYLH